VHGAHLWTYSFQAFDLHSRLPRKKFLLSRERLASIAVQCRTTLRYGSFSYLQIEGFCGPLLWRLWIGKKQFSGHNGVLSHAGTLFEVLEFIVQVALLRPNHVFRAHRKRVVQRDTGFCCLCALCHVFDDLLERIGADHAVCGLP